MLATKRIHELERWPKPGERTPNGYSTEYNEWVVRKHILKLRTQADVAEQLLAELLETPPPQNEIFRAAWEKLLNDARGDK